MIPDFPEILKRIPMSDQGRKKLIHIADNLGYIADLSESDVFIDAFDENGEMIVLAEARPSYLPSLYKDSVAGMPVKKEFEPAVYHSLELLAPVNDIIGITQEGRFVKQTVVPVIGEDGKAVAALVREKDITERREKDRKYAELAFGKEDGIRLEDSAAREMNHRMKNNLQVVVSMMRLDAAGMRTPAERVFLEKTIGRVLLFSTLCDILSSGPDGEKADVLVLADRICSALKEAFLDERGISATVSGDSVLMDSNRAAAAGTVLNELIFNAAEHAFKNEGGNIRVTVTKGSSIAVIAVEDDGAGFDTASVEPGYGLRIAARTVRDKLNGVLKVLSDRSGTRAFFDAEI